MSTAEEAPHRPPTRMAMTILGLIMAHLVAGKTSRDAIFLSQFSTTNLPSMVAVAAIAAVAMSMLGSRMLVRFGPNRMTVFSFALSGIMQVAEWMLFSYHPRIAACVIYVHVVTFGAVLVSAFWSLMNESIEPRSAKMVFAKISWSGTLGGFLGGLLAERVAGLFSAQAVILVLATLHMLCAGLLWMAFPLKAGPPVREQPLTGKREPAVIAALQRYPFLLTLAGLVLASSVGASLIDFAFKARAAQTIGRGAALFHFFGLYYTAMSLLTFLAQTFLSRFCLKQAGLAASAGALPAAVTLGSLLSAVFPGVNLLSVMRGMEIVIRGSIYRSAYELFYTAIAPGDKRSAKSLIDVGVERVGDLLGAGTVSLLLVLSPSRYGLILFAASGISAIALWLAARLNRGYVRALEKSLFDRAVELDPSLLDDSTTRSVLMRSMDIQRSPFAGDAPMAAASPHLAKVDPFLRRATDLRSGEGERAIAAAKEIGPDDWNLAPLLIELLAWDEVMPAARSALERLGPRIGGILVDALLDPDRAFVIRRRIPRVLATIRSARSAEGLFEALQDQRFEVRFFAGRALHLLVKDRPELMIAPDRVWDAINRELSHQRSLWVNHRLLDRRGANEKQWFFDDQLLDRADRNLEHLFTLLGLLLPGDAARIAFRALHTDDRQLKGTAFEYLESATPPDTRQLLLPLLEANAEGRLRSADAERALRDLLASKIKVNIKLNLDPVETEAWP
jgi:AAA family ATP:ADP antiporter